MNRQLGKLSTLGCCILLAALASQHAFALGLGEARVESFLHQPLDVRMRILDFSEGELDSLSVGIASAADYNRLGLMSSALALDLRVSVDRSVSPPVVRIVSTRVVDDPVVQLLVDARWASGRMLREYTLFLDPPAIEMRPPARPDTETRPAEAVSTPPPPARTTPASPPSMPPTPRAAPIGDRYGPVASGETLWTIARQARPSDDITMNQMMLAIVDLNPQAFRDGNINRLLRGAELRIPDENRIRAIDAATAAADVAAQNRAFRQGRTGEVQRISAAARDEVEESLMPPARPEPAAQPSTAAEREARLSLVPPDEDEGGAGLSDNAAEIEQLRQRLARAEEELFAARAEARDFRSRVEELEQAVSRGADNGLGLRDADLARLEQTLREARLALEDTDDAERRSEISDRIEQLLSDATQDPVGDDGVVADVPPPVDASPDSEQTEPAVAPEPAPVRPDDQTGWLANPLLVTGLVVFLLAVALAVTYVLVQRRRRQHEPTRRPLRRAAELHKPSMSPALSPQDRIENNPADLAAHLALLRQLEGAGDRETFAAAFEEMFEHVDNGDEPEWRDAVKLAGKIVPGHALVKGSTDAVAEGSSDDSPLADDPAQGADRDGGRETGREEPADAEGVDDLMSRLDDEVDESEGLDWLDDSDRPVESQQRDAPIRENEDFRSAQDRPITSFEADDDEEIDFGELDADQDDPHDPESSLTDSDQSDPGAAGTRTAEESAASADDEAEDGFLLDWPDEPDADERPVGESSSGESVLGDKDGESDGDDEDIFAAGDDDAEVKLDLARAYLSWSSGESARTLLEEVQREGNAEQRAEAGRLLDSLKDRSGDDSTDDSPDSRDS
ncbi:MAG: FimV/HubP family polar landmark protein [Wenzhouxiangellaceae bacterium]